MLISCKYTPMNRGVNKNILSWMFRFTGNDTFFTMRFSGSIKSNNKGREDAKTRRNKG